MRLRYYFIPCRRRPITTSTSSWLLRPPAIRPHPYPLPCPNPPPPPPSPLLRLWMLLRPNQLQLHQSMPIVRRKTQIRPPPATRERSAVHRAAPRLSEDACNLWDPYISNISHGSSQNHCYTNEVLSCCCHYYFHYRLRLFSSHSVCFSSSPFRNSYWRRTLFVPVSLSRQFGIAHYSSPWPPSSLSLLPPPNIQFFPHSAKQLSPNYLLPRSNWS